MGYIVPIILQNENQLVYVLMIFDEFRQYFLDSLIK